jgi:hypothetical protein
VHYRIAIILTASALGLLLGVPYGLYAWADSALDTEPCATGVEQAPQESFYQAVAVLDAVSILPWFADLASVRSARASTHCLVVYQDACDVPRDEAVAAAHAALASRLGVSDAASALAAEANGLSADADSDANGNGTGASASAEGDAMNRDTDWRHHISADAVETLCGGWQDWRVWLDEAGLDASAACPICS